jgi:hypothetical protein
VAQQPRFGSAPPNVPTPARFASVRLVPLTPTATATSPIVSGIVRISTAPDGSPASDESFAPAISADGRYIAYVSDASNSIAGGTDGRRHVFVFDRRAASTRSPASPAEARSPTV